MKNQQQFESEFLKDVLNVSQKTRDALYSAYVIGYNESEAKHLTVDIMSTFQKLSRNKEQVEN